MTPDIFHPDLLRALAGAALEPGLRSVLLFDADPPALRALALLAGQMVELATDRPAQITPLAYVQSEDTLWGGLALRRDGGGVDWVPGMLTGELAEAPTDPRPMPLVVIPDLPRLGLSALRACVALMSAEEACLERHGRSARWRPTIFWLAACAREDAGQLSAHLLDRFALRLSVGRLSSAGRATTLRAEARRDGGTQHALPADLRHALERGRTTNPAIGAEGLAEALRYFPNPATSPRRPLALVRLGFALAAMDGAFEFSSPHIARAAALLHLRVPASAENATFEATPAAGGQPDMRAPVTSAEARTPEAQPNTPAPVTPVALATAEELVFEPDTTVVVATALNPYPEDERHSEHSAESLRTPGCRHYDTASASGPIIGVEPAVNTVDLAVLSTLIEARKFQVWRRAALRRKRPGFDPPAGQLILAPSDLRRYRRAPIVEQLLLLVMDYTSLGGCNWPVALVDHIMWAYQKRAAVTLVQVGAAVSPADECRAHLLSVPNVLVPALNSALNAEPGRATPLAHGLELALQTLRRATQSGRNAVQQARLVVLTDGRGNVPLDANLSGVISGFVGRRGVEDALARAPALAQISRVRRVLLNPQPRQHADLPVRLAVALGAELVSIPLLGPEVPR